MGRVRRWIEYENGNRSTDYASETEAWAVLVDPKSSDQHIRPLWLFSSESACGASLRLGRFFH